ncbi:MAG TPA: ABC transporter ATP-binding protein [Candidatus Binatia bacterium]|nr:ABC transporter ATP-binding protein [Candidatus Binatia bacterium]
MNEAVVELRDVAVSLDGRPVLWNISFAVAPGHLLGIIGPNGAGKTTLLRAILGLVKPDRGTIRVLGKAPQQLGRGAHQIGYVPQRRDFDPRFPVTVRDVAMMGRSGHLGLLRFARREDWEQVDAMVRLVGLAEQADRLIGELSGGEQQRAFLARALCTDTRLLLLDEATTGLDLPAQHDLYNLLQRLRRDLKLAVIAVSHDLLALGAHADELLCINGTAHIHGNPQEVLQSHQLREAYRCEFDFLSDEARVAHPEP